MKISIECHVDVRRNLAKVQDDGFWKFAANEWHKLISPYTPMQTGGVMETVDIRPKEIEYLHPGARYLYHGKLMVDAETGSAWARKDSKKVLTQTPLQYQKDKHPLATKEWDKVAEPTQKPKLIRAMQGYINRGGLNLDG